MGIQTRSSASSSPAKCDDTTRVVVPVADEEPDKIFVLPSHASKDGRIILLKHPRDGSSRQYYFCPCRGLFEITKVGATGLDSRSILIAEDNEETDSARKEKFNEPESVEVANGSALSSKLVDSQMCNGHVNKLAEIFITTPFDPVFFLLPLLHRPTSSQRERTGPVLFQPLDDLLDVHLDAEGHLRYVLTNPTFRPRLLNAMSEICDSVLAGDEEMYRLNMIKVYEYLLQKAESVVKQGLPASLEDRFVTRALEIPMYSLQQEESAVSVRIQNNEVDPGSATPGLTESQSSTSSTMTAATLTEAYSAASVQTVDGRAVAGLQNLQRLRTAMSFITASYLDPCLAEQLSEVSHDSKLSPSFGPLDDYIQKLAKWRAEALAARSLSDFSKKRDHEDDEVAEGRAEKKRKQEEEDKRKKSQESRGVRDLKKADVSGMKKMNAFFTKKVPSATPMQ